MLREFLYDGVYFYGLSVRESGGLEFEVNGEYLKSLLWIVDSESFVGLLGSVRF